MSFRVGEPVFFKIGEDHYATTVYRLVAHVEDVPPSKRAVGCVWNELTVIESEKGAFVVRERTRRKLERKSETIGIEWYPPFAKLADVSTWLRARAVGPSASAPALLARRALERLDATEV